MDRELIFWIAAAAVAWIVFGVLVRFAKKEGENYVELE